MDGGATAIPPETAAPSRQPNAASTVGEGGVPFAGTARAVGVDCGRK
jgi:hypothetical protein